VGIGWGGVGAGVRKGGGRRKRWKGWRIVNEGMRNGGGGCGEERWRGGKEKTELVRVKDEDMVGKREEGWGRRGCKVFMKGLSKKGREG